MSADGTPESGAKEIAEQGRKADDEQSGKTFEENITRLETLVRQLERGELSLEDALLCYKEGVALVSLCQERLERTASEVEILTEGMNTRVDEKESP